MQGHGNSIISFVCGELESAAKCQKAHIKIFDSKIRAIKQEIERLNKRLKSHRKYGNFKMSGARCKIVSVTFPCFNLTANQI
jgi:hypothetical protein